LVESGKERGGKKKKKKKGGANEELCGLSMPLLGKRRRGREVLNAKAFPRSRPGKNFGETSNLGRKKRIRPSFWWGQGIRRDRSVKTKKKRGGERSSAGMWQISRAKKRGTKKVRVTSTTGPIFSGSKTGKEGKEKKLEGKRDYRLATAGRKKEKESCRPVLGNGPVEQGERNKGLFVLMQWKGKKKKEGGGFWRRHLPTKKKSPKKGAL